MQYDIIDIDSKNQAIEEVKHNLIAKAEALAEQIQTIDFDDTEQVCQLWVNISLPDGVQRLTEDYLSMADSLRCCWVAKEFADKYDEQIDTLHLSGQHLAGGYEIKFNHDRGLIDVTRQ